MTCVPFELGQSISSRRCGGNGSWEGRRAGPTSSVMRLRRPTRLPRQSPSFCNADYLRCPSQTWADAKEERQDLYGQSTDQSSLTGDQVRGSRIRGFLCSRLPAPTIHGLVLLVHQHESCYTHWTDTPKLGPLLPYHYRNLYSRLILGLVARVLIL